MGGNLVRLTTFTERQTKEATILEDAEDRDDLCDGMEFKLENSSANGVRERLVVDEEEFTSSKGTDPQSATSRLQCI
jgi:hypothetical protein